MGSCLLRPLRSFRSHASPQVPPKPTMPGSCKVLVLDTMTGLVIQSIADAGEVVSLVPYRVRGTAIVKVALLRKDGYMVFAQTAS